MTDQTPPQTAQRTGLLARVGRTCFRNRGRVILAWLVLLVGLIMLSGSIGTDYADNFSLPGTDSQRAHDLLESSFPARAGDENTIVYKARSGSLTNPATRREIEQNLSEVEKLRYVGTVVSPYTPEGAGQISRDGKVAYATVILEKQAQDLPEDAAEPLIETAEQADNTKLEVALGGWSIQRASQGGPDSTALIGLLAALLILMVTFGSLVAAGLPLLTALFGIVSGIAILGLGSHLIDTPDWSPQLAEMIGLGVGIDYALFIVTRFRAEMKLGRSREDATVVALDTAGRAVFFAGCTVMIALLGMLLLGIDFMRGLAIWTSVTVFFVMLASLTLLPAFLRVFGKRIDSLRLPVVGRGNRTEARWESWSRFIQRRPWPAAIAAVVILLVLAAPALSVRLASSDAGNDPPGKTTRVAYDNLSDGFGDGFNGPFLVVVELPEQGSKAALAKVAGQLRGQPGVAAVSPPRINPGGDTAVLSLQPTTSPQSEQTEDLLANLRNDVIPGVESATGTQIFIGGNTAGTTDFSRVLADKLPLFIGVVVLLSCLLLLLVFRSVWIPVKAAIMNLLSIGAALGLVTWVFQEGVGASLLGVEATGPIEPFVPVMMFAIVFGLSMDYEVFLMSRIHEEWMVSKEASASARRGLALTGRVITAAASIMVVVFASFMIGDDRVIKMFGLGLASAVLIDAVIIRCLLVPAVMELLGKNAWWLPAWLDRLLPKLSLESQEELAEAAQAGRRATEQPQPTAAG